MLNVFKLKKYAALILAGFLPAITFFVCLKIYSFWIALVGLLVSIGFSIVIGSVMLKNPFSLMLEGKGLLALNIDSTGIIRPFLLGIKQPYVKGKLGNDQVNDVYDREAVAQLSPPAKAGSAILDNKEGKVTITLDEGEFNRARFGLYQYPVLIYNAQVKSLLTKDFLSNEEKNSFAEHGVLYLNRKMEELTSIVRDFGRYVVELTKPKESIFQNKWTWIIIAVFVIIMVALFAKPVIQQIAGAFNTGGSAIAGAAAPVVPR